MISGLLKFAIEENLPDITRSLIKERDELLEWKSSATEQQTKWLEWGIDLLLAHGRVTVGASIFDEVTKLVEEKLRCNS
jgi:hypothetical protein